MIPYVKSRVNGKLAGLCNIYSSKSLYNQLNSAGPPTRAVATNLQREKTLSLMQ